jgi:hypothetical protein
MAPPDRGDTPRRGDSLADLAQVRLDEASGSRLSGTAGVLASWVEWLLHPEEHEHDRTVIYPNGHKKEEPGPVAPDTDQPGTLPSDAQLPFESVIAQWNLLQFLDGMASVATQQVERPSSPLAIGSAAIKNVWWLGDKRMLELVHTFPSKEEWDGTAAGQAREFIGDLATAVTQLNKIVQEFNSIPAQYAVIIKTARDNFQKAADEFIKACQDKFYKKKQESSINVLGIVLGTLAAGAVSFMTGGLALPIIGEAMVLSAWSQTFTEGAKVLASRGDTQGTLSSVWWRDLATSYMVTQAKLRKDTIDAINTLKGKTEELINQFNADVEPFLRKYGG